MKDFFSAISYIFLAIFTGWIISSFGFSLVWSIAIPTIMIFVLSKKYDYDKKNNEKGMQSKKTEKIDKNPTPVLKKNHPVQKSINSIPPGFWSKAGHHFRTNAYYPSFDFDENGWSKTPVYLPKTANNEYVHVDTGDRINEDGKTRREVINEKAKIEVSLEKKEAKPNQENINIQEYQHQSTLNQLNKGFLDFVQQYYSLTKQKTNIVKTINDFEKNKFDYIGEITLKILELKQNDSYRSKEDYKSYLTLYEAHKQKDYHAYLNVEKPNTAFVNNIPAISNKIKDIQFQITMLQKELKILEQKDVYKLAKKLDAKSYFEFEKQKLEMELGALEAEKKSAKKYILTEQISIEDIKKKTIIPASWDNEGYHRTTKVYYPSLDFDEFGWSKKAVYVPKIGSEQYVHIITGDCFDQQGHACNKERSAQSTIDNENSVSATLKETKVTIYEDKELSKLKIQLKSLESRLQELIEDKTEYMNNLEEFNREYNIRLGDIIRDILNLRKEILSKKIIHQQTLKIKYQEDLQTFKETQVTIEELKSSIDELKEVLDLIDEDHEDYEEILAAYNELNVELDKLEQELSDQETDLAKTKESFDDDELFQQYEEAKSSADEFDESYEHIKEFQKEKIDLRNEEKAELKKLFRKAARLCHPDIVPDELKEQATQMMQQLNVAYDKQDLAQVRKILDSLENGSGFELSSDHIEDKEQLKEKIQEYKENIAHIESEIEEILHDDTYQTISTLDDRDAYFEDLKKDLEAEKQKLEEEAREILEQKDEVVKKVDNQPKSAPTKEKAKKILIESSPYATHIKTIEVPNFEKIRRYCNNLVDDHKADEMQKYLAENGRMHKAIIYDALEQFIVQLSGKEIALADWGCDQGIASMLVLDYIREKQIDVRVKNVTLIDDDIQTLGRAMAQVEALKENTVVIEAIDANSDLVLERTPALKSPIIHLFANDMIPMNISKIRLGSGYAVCLSYQSAKNVDSISNAIKGTQISKRDGKIGRFQRFERILKVI